MAEIMKQAPGGTIPAPPAVTSPPVHYRFRHDAPFLTLSSQGRAQLSGGETGKRTAAAGQPP
jgi:hypothetical protein